MTHILHTSTVHKTASLADEGAILHIASLVVHTTLNIYKSMEISIKRSPQHWCPSEGLNSEIFAHKNDAFKVDKISTILCRLTISRFFRKMTFKKHSRLIFGIIFLLSTKTFYKVINYMSNLTHSFCIYKTMFPKHNLTVCNKVCCEIIA